MTPNKNCDDWVDYLYKEWLDGWVRNDLSEAYLRESTKNLVERVKKSSDQQEIAWNLMGRLKRLSDNFYNVEEAKEQKYLYERAEVYMECAYTAYKMGDIQESLTLFRVANDGFPRRSLHKALCYWWIGCIQWQTPSSFENAILSWDRGMQIVREVGLDRSQSNTRKAKRCEEVAEIMRGVIDRTTRDDFPPPPPMTTGATKKTASSGLSAYSSRLKFLPYFGSIPAGNPVSALQHPDGEGGVDYLDINGHTYNIFSIKNEREICLHHGTQYFLMKACGHSMNTSIPVPIEDGNYVLLKNTQQAQSNDIVAAVVFGQGEPAAATLKRYHEDGGGRYVMSESSVDTINLRLSDSDYIQGVALAILKPADD
jgi:SOS-response transcriptional repressor LexA